ncbi:phosphoenolpyruvate--protein phosphotransferase [Oleispirillum naphthae]|uniref:phosphoenolpyruvate--protein phosphotransferase n=1 Tax=Oleispirillum naphthae TaxID=2838853 RepID=UPI00308250A3
MKIDDQPIPELPTRIMHGLGVSPGIALGIAYVHETGGLSVIEYCIPEARIAQEVARFREAVAHVAADLRKIQEDVRRLPGQSAEEVAVILEAHVLMLKRSRLVRGVETLIAEKSINAEAAVKHQIDDLMETFAAMEDGYLAGRADDVRDLGQRLVRRLGHGEGTPFADLPRQSIVLADELTPADTAQMDPARVVAFATELGGIASHTAIMARSLGIPAVVGVSGLTHNLCAGCTVIVDGTAGRVILNPTSEQLADYRKWRAAALRRFRSLNRLRALPAVTRDGLRATLLANIERPEETSAAVLAGAEGIGLFRSEFLYMNRDDVPTADEQYGILRNVVERMDGLPVTFRTLDVGGDKLSRLFDLAAGPNPAMGLRAVRLSLARPELLRAQFEAAFRAARHGPVRVLLPMVASPDELRQCRVHYAETFAALSRARVALPDEPPPLGVMIEVPGAALNADAIAKEADFLSIGTNDLTQYTLAIDRSDEQVSHLYDSMHPAVLRLIHFTTEAGRRARVPVSVCGEVAGDPHYTGLLLGMGIKELSMAPGNLLFVKAQVRQMEAAAAHALVQAVLRQSEGTEIRALVAAFNGEDA